MSQSKTWVYTLNNYTHQDEQRFKDFECSYQVIGKEVSSTGTPHLQGFITFKRAYRLTQLKKLVPAAHWEIAVASDAGNYCMKEDYIIIDNRRQGRRSDLTDAIEDLRSDGIKKVKRDHPETYVKFHAGLEKLASDKEPRNFKPYVEWIWGPTGAGKTYAVVQKEKSLWFSGKNLRWWQGYSDQEATIFDDFRADFCTFHELLRIIDFTPYTVEVKGSSVELTAKRMYITSCFPPDKVYETREDIDQLLRRIDKITHMPTKFGGVALAPDFVLPTIDEEPADPFAFNWAENDDFERNLY